MAIAMQFCHSLKAKLSGLFIAYFLFAGYVIFDMASVALLPDSGRLSTFHCARDSAEQMICTITIYGLRGTTQQTFPANAASRAYKSYVGDGTDFHTCGIDIIGPGHAKMTFVLANQNCSDSRLDQTIEEVNKQLLAIQQEPAAKIFYNGINPGLPQYLLVRMVLLTGSWCAVLVLSELRKAGGRHKKVFPRSNQSAFARNVFSWWGINILTRLFFYLYIAATFLYAIWIFDAEPIWKASLEVGSFYNVCFGLEEFRRSPASLLFGLYPFVGFATLQAFVQWRYLRRRILLSAWWAATPILVIAPLAIVLGWFMTTTRNDCLAFKLIFSGVYVFLRSTPVFIGKHALILLFSYFILIGCVQWFLLRQQLRFAATWIFVPFLNALTLFALGFLSYRLGGIGAMVLPGPFFITRLQGIMLLLASLVAQDIISAVFLAGILHANDSDRQQFIPAPAA